MSFQDIHVKNVFLLLCMHWTPSVKNLAKKANEIYFLENLPIQGKAALTLNSRQKSMAEEVDLLQIKEREVYE